ncbi:citramalate synthase [Thermobispora bispora]|jgi:2-isopropylmalate synthase|uniref:Citramalate synthase n=1 Tax=Thermobispora bispora (strain ATCC 19993 / DSM 43833 / CBS 139.67 / JCM 10125 / KCTC 9307 / NBRC 14880 / R51) TaxID=469371 RepID=D6Y692_THEBD|nr:citramalate synthase [Thermobispora bispora]MBO2475303.1 citramalate synthase [Actinomycetales bacterium]MDI9581224.1 citramalate synthase [Thermobispora sp.]ADG89508.1 2-isopropylmalate synthase/homocitrate synthase family protein [Thermobispora bispora DSM 43833]MBX6166648.1 citramalate synthase [Thermobispora bispora]QSI49136.1 citramalate synthase [Thermobispora bispora]
MADDRFHVYDTTLRDGAQQEGLNLTVADKLAIARYLDRLGVGFIEGGWPGANPKDTEFFRRARTELDLKHAQLAAFGSTRRPGMKAADDPLVAALRESEAPVVTLVAKSHDRHVELALRTTLEENLEMIRDTVSHLRAEGRRVFLDAEHFFDGYRSNPAYALEVIRTAAEAGADVVALCDTNGGMLPDELADVVHEAVTATGARIGIHCHDDSGCAVANTLAAVKAGATHVQGCANGYGERSGNANLFTVVANLQLKRGYDLVPPESLRELTHIAHAISEITNVTPNSHQPYVGVSAFAHKAGLHASAIKVDPMLYQHIDPALVGNDMRMLVSDMAGRASVELKGRALGYELTREQSTALVERVKELEAQGYTFEAADASFELLLRDTVGELRPRYFTVESWRVIVERRPDGEVVSEATVKLNAKGERIIATGEGNGPVNALDKAVRVALERLYPELAAVELIDYKVRILEGSHGTGAVTRVLITSSDTDGEWSTVGVDENIIEASWQALEQAVTYGLLRAGRTAP